MTVLLIDRIGRKTIQVIGFTMTAILYIILGTFFAELVKQKWIFLILYGLSFFFTQFGANTTTYTLPSESFPTQIRATCHGISSASGKLGAFLGGLAFSPLVKYQGLPVTLEICGILSVVGLALTYFCIKETMGKPLPEEPNILDEHKKILELKEELDEEKRRRSILGQQQQQ